MKKKQAIITEDINFALWFLKKMCWCSDTHAFVCRFRKKLKDVPPSNLYWRNWARFDAEDVDRRDV